MAEASSLVSVIDQQFLACGICHGPFDDPRALPCLHPFCCGCLETRAKDNSKDGKIVRCPTCNKVYQIPKEDGIKAFPAHFLVANLQSTVDVAKQTSHGGLCENHSKTKEYFCENCSCAACSDCGLLDPNHRGHTFIRLNNLTREVRDRVQQKYVTAAQQARQMKQDLERATNSDIQAIDEFLHRVRNITGSLKQDIYRQKVVNMNAIQQSIDKRQADLTASRHSCEFATNLATSGSDSDVATFYPLLSSTLQRFAESEPSSVDSTLGEIQLEPPLHDKVDVSSLLQFLNGKLHTTMAPGENEDISRASNQNTEHNMLAQQTFGTKSMSPSTASATSKQMLSAPVRSLTATANYVPYESALVVTQKATTKPPPYESAVIVPQKVVAAEDPLLHVHKPPSQVPEKTTASEFKDHAKALTTGSRFSLLSRFRQNDQPTTKKWKERGKINLQHGSFLSGIAIHPNGDIALTSSNAPVTVFSSTGHFKHVLNGSPSGIFDIAITPSNQYVLPGKKGDNEFYLYDNDGSLLTTAPTYDIYHRPSIARTVAVDSTGRIIVGLVGKTVSIRTPDTTPISEFETMASPKWLTCTPDDRLIVSFGDQTLQVMDQSGHNASIIQPPPGMRSWSWKPAYVCCSKQGELFVSNWGNPTAVYRYVSTGGKYKYLDCISKMESFPYGIAMSADEEKLFVVGYSSSTIEIFE